MKLILVMFLFLHGCWGNFLNDHATGWWWYQNIPEENKDPVMTTPQKQDPKVKTLSPKEQQESYGKELANRLAKAWLNPTPDNVRNYQVMQQDMLEKSNQFANTWAVNLLKHPELDHTLKAPVNQKAIHLKADQDQKAKINAIQELASQFGLFFFFGGECAYCHQFAPTVKAFGAKYNWQVMAISVDGQSVPDFPNAELDNGLYESWKLTTLPVVVAVNPTTGEAIPIAQGMISLSEMEDRIMLMIKQRRKT